MTGAQLERFEARFQPLLERATEIPARLNGLLLDAVGESIAGDDFPVATATRQMLGVTPLYLAGVEALSTPESSLGALALLRPLIEAWSHLYFIMGEDDMADARCRAMRLEMGWADQARGLARVTDPLDLKVAERRYRQISDLKSQSGCKGGQRDYGDADATVKEMAERYRISWLVEAWRSSSQMVHGAGWDWTLEAVSPDGAMMAVDPTPTHRAARLNHLVVVFSNVAQTYLAIVMVLHTEAAERFTSETQALLNDRWFRRMTDGDFG